MRLFIEPWQRQREVISRVPVVLDRYNAETGTPGIGEEAAMDEAATELRRCMADLSAGPNIIPFYDKLHRILNLPSTKDLRVAQRAALGAVEFCP